MNYWLWIMPLLIGTAVVGAYANSEYNKHTSVIWYWMSIGAGVGLTVLWPCVAKYSTDLVRDNLIWAVACFFSGMIVLLLKGHFSNYTASQCIGFICVVVGFVLMRK